MNEIEKSQLTTLLVATAVTVIPVAASVIIAALRRIERRLNANDRRGAVRDDERLQLMNDVRDVKNAVEKKEQ